MNDRRAYLITQGIVIACWGYFFGSTIPGYEKGVLIVMGVVVTLFMLYIWVPLLYKMSKHVRGFEE